MSIRISRERCVGCGRCVEACPGNLIRLECADAVFKQQPHDGNVLKKAVIRRGKDCWGCTACLKECSAGAIDFFLGADIGGRGSTLSVKRQGDVRLWTVTAPDGQKKTIDVNTKESNRY